METHIDFQSSACFFQSCTSCSKLRMRSLLDAFCAFLYNASQRSLSISFRQPPSFCAAGDAHFVRCRLWTVLTWRSQFHDLSNVVPQCLHQ